MSEELGFGRRDENAEHHWDTEIPKECFLGHKSILIFPGDGAVESEEANGMCKIIRGFLDKNNLSEFSNHLYSVYYPNTGLCAAHRLYQKAALNKLDDKLYPLTQKYSPYYETFYQTYLLPLVSKNEGKERLSLEEAKQNLRNLTVVGYCHGSVVALEMEKMFQESMKNLGYSKLESNEIQKQLFIFNVSSAMPYGESLSTVLHVVSHQDHTAVHNWRIGTLNYYTQIQGLEDKPAVLLPVSGHENVMLLNSLYEASKVAEVDGQTPDEHRAELYFNLSLHDDIRSPKSNEIIQLSQSVLANALTRNDEMPELRSLLPDGFLSRDILHQGKVYLKKYHEDVTQYTEAKDKMFAGIHVQNPDVFKALTSVNILLQRDAKGKSAFEYITESGNLKQTRDMVRFLTQINEENPFRNIPLRHLNQALSTSITQRRFDIANLLIPKGSSGIPMQITAETIMADDVPAILPIIKKISLHTQALYSLLPIYMKASKISDSQQRQSTQEALLQRLTPKNLDIKNAFGLYKEAGKYDENSRTNLQDCYQEQINKQVISSKRFYDVFEIETSKQSKENKTLYNLLSPKAKQYMETFCHKEMKKNLESFVTGSLRYGVRSDYMIYITLYGRHLDTAGKEKFNNKIVELNKSYKEKTRDSKELSNELRTYIQAQNPDVFSSAFTSMQLAKNRDI